MYNLIIPGARFYNQLDAALTHNDIIEAELSKEIESARLFRLLTKLCTVVDRAELNGDFGWAEYGDRYMLKLFRDYIFHQVCSLFRLTFFLRFINGVLDLLSEMLFLGGRCPNPPNFEVVFLLKLDL